MSVAVCVSAGREAATMFLYPPPAVFYVHGGLRAKWRTSTTDEESQPTLDSSGSTNNPGASRVGETMVPISRAALAREIRE